MIVYAVVSGLVVPKHVFFPADVLNTEAFLSLFGFPVQLVRGVCALTMAALLWHRLEKR